MSPETEQSLIALALPDHVAAQALYRQLCAASQVLDDVLDGDKPVSAEHVIAAFVVCSVDLLRNPVAQQFPHEVAEMIESAIQGWLHATDIERAVRDPAARADGSAERLLQVSYITRSTTTNLLLRLARLLFGREHERAIALTVQRTVYLDNEIFERYRVEHGGR